MNSIKSVSNNERVILSVVQQNEPIQRSSIRAMTSLTQPSVHRILDSLVDKKLIVIGKAKASGPGKPSPEISLNRSGAYSIGVSVNTDDITVCLANFACEPVREVIFNDAIGDRERSLKRIQVEVSQMLAAESLTVERVTGICLALPGFFIDKQYQLNPPFPLSDWSLINLKQEMERLFQLPVWVANNATTGAIGEGLIGIGRWAKTFAYLSFNYGFGGGLIIDGKPFYGAHGNAMEISGIYDSADSQRRPALELLIKKLNARGIQITTVEELQASFDPNWPGVEEWVEEVLPMLNRAIWAIRSVVDPEVVVLGGQIPKALAEILLARISLRSEEIYRYDSPIPVPLIKYAEASNVGAALGAALVPLKANFL